MDSLDSSSLLPIAGGRMDNREQDIKANSRNQERNQDDK